MRAAKDQAKTLVFVESVQAASSAAAALRDVGIEPLVYHRDISNEERHAILSAANSGQGTQ